MPRCRFKSPVGCTCFVNVSMLIEERATWFSQCDRPVAVGNCIISLIGDIKSTRPPSHRIPLPPCVLGNRLFLSQHGGRQVWRR